MKNFMFGLLAILCVPVLLVCVPFVLVYKLGEATRQVAKDERWI